MALPWCPSPPLTGPCQSWAHSITLCFRLVTSPSPQSHTHWENPVGFLKLKSTKLGGPHRLGPWEFLTLKLDHTQPSAIHFKGFLPALIQRRLLTVSCDSLWAPSSLSPPSLCFPPVSLPGARPVLGPGCLCKEHPVSGTHTSSWAGKGWNRTGPGRRSAPPRPGVRSAPSVFQLTAWEVVSAGPVPALPRAPELPPRRSRVSATGTMRAYSGSCSPRKTRLQTLAFCCLPFNRVMKMHRRPKCPNL